MKEFDFLTELDHLKESDIIVVHEGGTNIDFWYLFKNGGQLKGFNLPVKDADLGSVVNMETTTVCFYNGGPKSFSSIDPEKKKNYIKSLNLKIEEYKTNILLEYEQKFNTVKERIAFFELDGVTNSN